MTRDRLKLTTPNTPHSISTASMVEMQMPVNTWNQKETSRSLRIKRRMLISMTMNTSTGQKTRLQRHTKRFMGKIAAPDNMVIKKDQVRGFTTKAHRHKRSGGHLLSPTLRTCPLITLTTEERRAALTSGTIRLHSGTSARERQEKDTR